MPISFQTNYASMVAAENLNTNNKFQTNTIEQLTSGYRINSSGDDAAGLAVANGYRSNVAELTQGVLNASNGTSQLQIVDGGLSNISQMLDRLKTLATESASTTFSGDRTTLNNEFQSVLGEINRQAADIHLDSSGAAGSLATNMNVYIGGGNASNATNSNAMVSVNLTGSTVDAGGLGISNSSVLGGGVEFTGTTLTNALLNNPTAVFSASQTFTVNYINANGVATQQNVSYTGSGNTTGASVVQQLNQSLANNNVTGITAQIGSDGQLQFVSGGAFTITTVSTANAAVNNGTGNPLTLVNTGNYNAQGARALMDYAVNGGTAPSDTVLFTDSATGKTTSFVFNSTSADTIGDAVNNLNTQFAQAGLNIKALNDNGYLSLQSPDNFTALETAATAGDGVKGTGDSGFGTAQTVGAFATPSVTQASSATGAALAAIDSISAAVAKLGLVQGKVGAGENTLNYAINLANSQITNFSSAESQIRDADVATEAANLTKAQVLEQASVAAMAQANSAPQAILKLLQ